jgi:hypothetical protein
MPSYSAQSPYPATVLQNQVDMQTHRTLKADIRTAMDAVIAEGED